MGLNPPPWHYRPTGLDDREGTNVTESELDEAIIEARQAVDDAEDELHRAMNHLADLLTDRGADA